MGARGHRASGVAVILVAAGCAAGCGALVGIEAIDFRDRVAEDAGAIDAGAGADAGAVDANARDDVGALVDAADGRGPIVDTVSNAYGLGNGRDGARTITTSGVVVNSYTSLTAAAAAGARALSLANATVVPIGALVLVLPTVGLDAALGRGASVSLPQASVGGFQLARVVSANGADVTLDAALSRAFQAGTQIIRVPEYTDLTIAKGASIVPAPWDGTKGGVVIAFATGTIDVEGAIDASGAGFRGGGLVAAEKNGCPAGTIDGAPADGFAPKGEGLAVVGAGGRGRNANGGGGGNCSQSGGGGGGHAGLGGGGGQSYDGARPVGGVGGAALAYSLADALALGGGGGAGHVDVYARDMHGGAGGGAIVVRAASVRGAGTWSARGAGAQVDTDNGGSGGGAGGAVLIRATGDVTCGGVSVRGGDGSTSFAGPGGGGGGGRTLVQGRTTSCPVDVGGGAAGVQTSNGSTAGQDGEVELSLGGAFCASTAPCAQGTCRAPGVCEP